MAGNIKIRKRFFLLISQIGISYRESSLSEHSGDGEFAVKAGDRMPFLRVNGKSVYDCLRAPKFHLLTFSEKKSIAAKRAKIYGMGYRYWRGITQT